VVLGSFAIEPLRALLKNGRVDIAARSTAIRILGKIGSSQHVGILMGFVHSVGGDDAVEALEMLDPFWWRSDEARATVPFLIDTLFSGWGEPVKEHAEKTLDRIQPGWFERPDVKAAVLAGLQGKRSARSDLIASLAVRIGNDDEVFEALTVRLRNE